jgi:hypothetical protein
VTALRVAVVVRGARFALDPRGICILAVASGKAKLPQQSQYVRLSTSVGRFLRMRVASYPVRRRLSTMFFSLNHLALLFSELLYSSCGHPPLAHLHIDLTY